MSGNDVNPYQSPEPDEDPLEIREDPLASVPTPDEGGGNRPAEGARQATPGEILSEDFAGGENAGDFLGLDLEFDEPSGIAPTGTSEPPQAELEVSEALQLGAPAAIEPETPAESSVGSVDFQPQDEFYGDPAEAQGEEGFDPDGEFDAELEEDVQPAGKARMILITAVVMAIAFGGVWFGRGYLQKGSTEAPVAQGTRAPVPQGNAQPETTPNAQAEPAAEVGLEIAEVAPEATPEPLPVESFGAAGHEPSGSLIGSGADPTALVGREDVLVTLTDFLHETLVEGGGEALGNESPTQPIGTDPNVASNGTAPAEPNAELFASLNWADPGGLDIIWRGTDVPMDAIASPARVMMPRVGRVRLALHSGENLDGQMVAVGQGRVWVDADIGRIGLDNELIAEILHLQSANHDGAVNRIEIVSGDRVRIRLPGGSIQARVVSETDGLVTVRTDNGAKLILRNPEMERLGTGRVKVLEQGSK